MREINIDVSPQYKVIIDSSLLSKIGEYINRIGNYDRIAIITDDVVANLYLSQVEESIKSACDKVYTYSFPNGESSKSFDVLSDILEFLSLSELTRTDLVVALGGGVVGDMVGFASSIYLRGIDFVNIPTTLLSMVDSSVGGKTAINTKAGKNMVGAFYQPRIVLCDTNVVSSLSSELIADGVGEIAKYAILEDKGIIADLLTDNITLCLEGLIAKCVMIKNDYVSCDVYDKGKRQLLNLGHTLGHAIEKHSMYSISHGRSVLMGLYMLAEKFSGTDEIRSILSALEKIGIKYGMNVRYNKINADELWILAVNDKKRHGDYITLARPFAIGDCRLDNVKVASPINLSESVKKLSYDVIVSPVKLVGEINAPPSKSDVHRLLIAAAFKGTRITVSNIMFSDDINATLRALQVLGVRVDRYERSVSLLRGIIPSTATIDCGESATTLRFFLPICAMLGVETTFIGSDRLGERGYMDIITAMDNSIIFSQHSGFPLQIKGQYTSESINISGGLSSQFISGILLGAYADKRYVCINIEGELQSSKYVDMTLNTLSKFGAHSTQKRNKLEFQVVNQPVRENFNAESDYSNGAFFNVAGVKTVYNNISSSQGDRVIVDIVNKAYKDYLPFDISVRDTPDIAIILAVLATRLNGISRLRDCARLRLKECDRLEAILHIMKSCGFHAELDGEDIIITGSVSECYDNIVIDSFGDHRVAMSLAVLASITGRSIRINNAGVISKSYPDFWEDFISLGGVINVINIR